MQLATRRRSTAAILIHAVLVFTIVAPVSAGDPAIFSGKVYKESAANPEPGVVVTLVGPTSQQSYRSEPSKEDGTFRVNDAEPGEYQVVAETPRGAFLAGAPVELAPGYNRPVALTLGSDAPSYQTDPAAAGGSKGLPTWAKWTIVGGIAVIALFAIDQVVTDDDDDETPSSP
jgi:hypothetical protein